MGFNATIILSLAVLVFSIFGLAWLNLRQVERILDSMKGELKAEIKALDQKIDYGLAGVNARLDSLESRVGRIERQLDKIFEPMLK